MTMFLLVLSERKEVLLPSGIDWIPNKADFFKSRNALNSQNPAPLKLSLLRYPSAEFPILVPSCWDVAMPMLFLERFELSKAFIPSFTQRFDTCRDDEIT